MKTGIRAYLVIGAMLAACAVAADSTVPRNGRPAVRDTSSPSDPNDPSHFTNPPPVFQRGNQLSQPFPDTDSRVNGFLDFYSQQVLKTAPKPVPQVTKGELASLPPRYLDIADNGGTPPPDHFSSSLVCQSCHDSDWTATGNALPNMTFWAQGVKDPSHPTRADLAANWSLFGDWSGSIKALAGRDPVFLAQVETTREINNTIRGDHIDNLCFRCHSPLAQRQVNKDGALFDHGMLYATASGSNYKNPFPQDPNSWSENAEYGALARDGISCSACHSISPTGGQPWNGTNYSVFYGDDQATQDQQKNPFGGDVVHRLMTATDNSPRPQFPFTASMYTEPSTIVGPDTKLNAAPMSRLALNLTTSSTSADPQSPNYLRDGEVCGSCHAVILPKVPVGYSGSMPVNHQMAPPSCPTSQATYTGDYLTDLCVGLDYEQTTYFEWLNSGYGTGTSTCLTCHMPSTKASSLDTGGKMLIAQINPDLQALYYKTDTTLTPRQHNRHALLGINLFVAEMFQQFSDVLGTQFYRQDDSVVPPYLQPPADNAVNNPGAEDGNANGWGNGNVQAVTSVQESDGTTGTPHSGKYFFQVSPGSELEVSLSSYAPLIEQGNVKALVSGYMRCDNLRQGFQFCDRATLNFGTDTDPGAPISGKAKTFKGWSKISGLLPLKTYTSDIAIWVDSTSTASLSLDDLSIVLQLPNGESIPVQAPRNYTIPNNMLNAEQSIVDLAVNRAQGTVIGKPAVEVAVDIPAVASNAKYVTATVTATNNAGHKFPSGAPFRRAFLELEMYDKDGHTLWASGQPNTYGVICKGACSADGSNILSSEFTLDPTLLQPHHTTISRQDQAQIYELRANDDKGNVTSNELQIFEVVKDNRLLPNQWIPVPWRDNSQTRLGLNLLQMATLTSPVDKVPGSDLLNDNYYKQPSMTGADQVTYQIPMPTGGVMPASIRVRMNYQSIPPSYLLGRFKEAATLNGGSPGAAMQRLIYMTSRLNTADLKLKDLTGRDLVQNWTMVLSEVTQPVTFQKQ